MDNNIYINYLLCITQKNIYNEIIKYYYNIHDFYNYYYVRLSYRNLCRIIIIIFHKENTNENTINARVQVGIIKIILYFISLLVRIC